MNRRFLWLYPAWIAVCAIAFVALRGADDPSRRHGRILSNDAANIALHVLAQRPQFQGYEVVHVTDPGRDSARWLVLCDRVPHTALHDAIVVELDAKDGHLLGIRKPVN